MCGASRLNLFLLPLFCVERWTFDLTFCIMKDEENPEDEYETQRSYN